MSDEHETITDAITQAITQLSKDLNVESAVLVSYLLNFSIAYMIHTYDDTEKVREYMGAVFEKYMDNSSKNKTLH